MTMTVVENGRTATGPAPVVLDLTDPRWTAFVATHPDATPFHLPAWATAVADCYRFRAFALTALSPSGSVLAGMPVVAVPRPARRGAKWVALPFTDHCPPLFADAAAAASWPALLRTALADSRPRRIDVRADVDGGAPHSAGVRHVLALTGDPDAVYRGFHRSQVQRNIRRAEREGVVVRVGDRPTDLTDIFYRLHLGTRRRQGVPVQPRRFFDLIRRHVLDAGHGTLLIAEHDGHPVAAAVFLRHNGTVVYKYGASDNDAWAVRPNHALFWQAIRTACLAGDTALDWGRTDLDNTGLRAFKSAWGAVEQPLRYTTFTGSGAPAESSDLAESPAARALAAVIRHSPPWVCAAVGEGLYRFTA
ncbi:MAG TPA: GNAT family N-acetyltransferase [Jatrophihabitans sp.]